MERGTLRREQRTIAEKDASEFTRRRDSFGLDRNMQRLADTGVFRTVSIT